MASVEMGGIILPKGALGLTPINQRLDCALEKYLG